MRRAVLLVIECPDEFEFTVVERIAGEVAFWAPDFGRLESTHALTITTEQQEAHVRSWRQYILDETCKRT